MNELRVLDPGVRTLIVDRGRPGWARLGIPRSGAADAEALLLANALCANDPGAAALEMAVRGPRLLVDADRCRVTLAGDAPLEVERGGGRQALTPWRSHTLRRGDLLRLGASRRLLGAVLAVGGGIAVAPRLGSRSTSLRGGLPGLLARPLRRGDRLPLGQVPGIDASTDLELPAAATGTTLHSEGPLRMLAGPQAGALDDAGWAKLTRTTWRVSPRSDRTGVRLDGPPLTLPGGADAPSQGCPLGAVQVTADGAPTILGVDRGTTGGYCVPAVIASVDLPRLGRFRPGQEVRLELVDAVTARDLLNRRAAELRALLDACRPATLAPP